MSHVHYKFSSMLSSDVVTFNGPSIALGELKHRIMACKRLKAANSNLQILNAQTNEEYTDANALILKNSSVIVRRVPAGAELEYVFNFFGQIADPSVPPPLARLIESPSLAETNIPEEEKIKVMMMQSCSYYSPSNYLKVPLGPLPPSDACFKCGQQGHSKKKCPNTGQKKNMEGVPRIKRSSGIPESFMVEVKDPNAKGTMITPKGKYAIPIINVEAYARKKKEKPPVLQEEPTSSSSSSSPAPVPDNLLSLFCREIRTDAAETPCCGRSYCDGCVRTALLESEGHTSPTCHQTGVSAGSLNANQLPGQELSPGILESASRIYGSSSGSIVATAGLCGCDVDELKNTFLSLLTTSFWGLVPGKRILKILRYGLEKHLPPNAHQLVSGKLHIVLTRVHDWKSVTVSEFASKEDLIQRYVDGELAMWRADFVSQTTITVSAFAGEYDICPRDGAAAFFNFQLSDCTLQISTRNLCRLQHIFQFPKRQVLDQFFACGYQDTVLFLKRLINFPVDYFEGFTLSLTDGSCQKGEETLHLKPELRELCSRATNSENATEEDPGTTQAEDEEEAPHHLDHSQKGPGQPQKSIFGPAAAFSPSLCFKERMSNLQPSLKAEPDLH
ncbi:hypothetical protein BTVI_109285 [Pitangus sulphuratus]|nr:hypothetical protein BTVI_109285 [Pitangus sulphuratus]